MEWAELLKMENKLNMRCNRHKCGSQVFQLSQVFYFKFFLDVFVPNLKNCI